jgi:hypothetical protein
MALESSKIGAGGGVRHDQSQATGLGRDDSWPRSPQSLKVSYSLRTRT